MLHTLCLNGKSWGTLNAYVTYEMTCGDHSMDNLLISPDMSATTSDPGGKEVVVDQGGKSEPNITNRVHETVGTISDYATDATQSKLPQTLEFLNDCAVRNVA